MRYRHTKEQSAELMRRALPLMAKQDAGLHPISYSVWYEYVSRENPPLLHRVDELTAGDRHLTEESTLGLYREHIAEINEESARRIGEGFQRVIAKIADSAQQAGVDAAAFHEVLETWIEELPPAERDAAEAGPLHTVVQATRHIQGAMTTLRGQLDESRKEIEVLRREVTRAHEEALADGLTGLANRRAFDAALEQCLERSASAAHTPCLLIADIDHFKRINDTYGHLLGDRVIRAVAQVLKSTATEFATVARYGGEEFAVILPDAPIEVARELAERIRLTIERSRIRRADTDVPLETITISIGVAQWANAESPTDLIARADRALYVSKNQGRNRVTLAA